MANETIGQQIGKQFGINAATSAFNSLVSLGTSAYNAKLDYKYWKRKTDYQNQLNLQNWKMQNEYNSPSAQIARLKSAGLSPELMYGQNGGSVNGIQSDIPSTGAGYGTHAEAMASQMQAPSLAEAMNADTNQWQAQNVQDRNTVLNALDLVRKNFTEVNTDYLKTLKNGENIKNAFNRLQVAITTLQWQALNRTYDVKTENPYDGSIEVRAVHGYEIQACVDALNYGTLLQGSYYTASNESNFAEQNSFNTQLLGQQINMAILAYNSAYKEYEYVYGKGKEREFQNKVVMEYAQAALAEYGIDDLNFRDKDDLEKYLIKHKGDKKFTSAVWNAWNNARLSYEQLIHNRTDASSQPYMDAIGQVGQFLSSVAIAYGMTRGVKTPSRGGLPSNGFSSNSTGYNPYPEGTEYNPRIMH